MLTEDVENNDNQLLFHLIRRDGIMLFTQHTVQIAPSFVYSDVINDNYNRKI